MNSNPIHSKLSLVYQQASATESNPSNNKAFATIYEQMLLQQRNNMTALPNQKPFGLNTPYPGFPLPQLQIHPPSNQQPISSPQSGSSSASSLLSISSNSRYKNPKNENVSPSRSPNYTTAEPINSHVSNLEYEAKYRAYMAHAAAAFPYSMLGIGSQANGNFGSPGQTNPMMHGFNSRQLMIENMSGFFPAGVFQQRASQHQQSEMAAQFQAAQQQNHAKVENEPKPAHSYIGLIALAILSTPEKRLVLSDIYQWILDNYPYFHSRGSGWRNSIRHNLSLNDCFMKSGRSSNGKGHYWTIHPANLEDFSRGDFRRRRAQRRVRKSLGLTLPEEDAEDEDENEILTPPSSLSPVPPTKVPILKTKSVQKDFRYSNPQVIKRSCSNSFMDNSDTYENQRKKLCKQQPMTNGSMVDQLYHMAASLVQQQKEQNMLKQCQRNEERPNDSAGTNDSAGNNSYNDTDSNGDDNSDASETQFSNPLEVFYATQGQGQKDQSGKKVEEFNQQRQLKRGFNVDSLLAPEGSKRLKKTMDTDRADRHSTDSKEDYEDSGKVETKDRQLRDSCITLSDTEADIDHPKSQAYLSEPNTKRKPHTSTPSNNRNEDQQNQNSPFSKLESRDVDVEKWKQTFSKIMARSYKNNNGKDQESAMTKPAAGTSTVNNQNNNA